MAINFPATPTLNQTYTFNGRTWTYNGVGWQATGASGLSVYTKTDFTATAAQTTFSVTYTVGFVDVYYNGSKLSITEYTATNGTSVVLGTACALNDIVETVAWTVSTTLNPALGVATATSLAIGGATIGSNALAVTGTTALSGLLTAAGGVSSTLTTDATSATTGSIITAGGISTQKALWVGTTSQHVGAAAFNSTITMDNNVAFQFKDSGGTARRSALLSATSTFYYGDIDNAVSGSKLALSANDFMNFSTNGSERARITSGGLVGIGMTPSNILDITQNQNAATIFKMLNTGTSTACSIQHNMTAGTATGSVALFGSGFSTTGLLRQGGFYLQGGGAGGVTIATEAAQPIYFGINNAEVARIDTSGNLLVGTTSAVTKLTVSGKGSFSTGVAVGTVSGSQAVYESDYQQAAILQYNFLPGYAAAIFAKVQGTNNDHWFGITGNYGTYGSATMVLQACNQITSNTSGNFITSDASGILTFGQIIAGASAYSSNATKTEFMRLDGSGNLFINKTTSVYSGKLEVTYNGAVSNGLTINESAGTAGTTFLPFICNTNLCGSITRGAGNTVLYNTSSDYRLKENVATYTSGLNVISQLQPRTYDWIADKLQDVGFIAHELQAVIPNAVSGEKDAVDAEGRIKPQGVDYSRIVPHLVAAMQEQQATIQELTTRLAALEAK